MVVKNFQETLLYLPHLVFVAGHVNESLYIFLAVISGQFSFFFICKFFRTIRRNRSYTISKYIYITCTYKVISNCLPTTNIHYKLPFLLQLCTYCKSLFSSRYNQFAEHEFAKMCTKWDSLPNPKP